MKKTRYSKQKKGFIDKMLSAISYTNITNTLMSSPLTLLGKSPEVKWLTDINVHNAFFLARYVTVVTYKVRG